MPWTADAPSDWSIHPSAQSPLSVERAGQRWIIVDANGINRARVVATGAVLFSTEAAARAVLERLT